MANLLKSLKEVLFKPGYLFLTLAGFGVILGTVVWLPNLGLINFVLRSDNFSASQKLLIFWQLLLTLTTNFSWWPRLAIMVLAGLSALNLSFLIYYYKKSFSLGAWAGLGFGGILSSVLGMGCISCGSALLTSIFGFSAAISFLGYLPFKGQEFAWL